MNAFNRHIKWLGILATLGISLNVASAKVFAAHRLIPAPIETIFAPQGFTEEDTAKIVVHGNFPNSCYSLDAVTAQVTPPTVTPTETIDGVINITATARLAESNEDHENLMCAQVITPFTAAVELGRLSSGTYQLVVTNLSQQNFGELIIGVPAPVPDEGGNFFASAHDVELFQADDGRQYLTITGEYPYMFIGCMVLQEVQTQFDGVNILVIHPLATIEDGAVCLPQSNTKEFSQTVVLDQNLPAGDILLHMRVMNGDSVDRLVTLE